MKLYIIKAEWRYEEGECIVGVCDAEHIEEMKEAYKRRYLDEVASSIRCFSVDEYVLNECY